jgi:serine/threonine protein phosphatase PrpC
MSVPEVRELSIAKDMEKNAGPCFLVIASDGVWGSMSSLEVCKLVSLLLNKQATPNSPVERSSSQAYGEKRLAAVTKKLVLTAKARPGNDDDVTAIVVVFSGMTKKDGSTYRIPPMGARSPRKLAGITPRAGGAAVTIMHAHTHTRTHTHTYTH